ncbi:MAG: UDP-N-acetylmuramoyl-L-alanine--D-glutamate ligase [Patescibacteria group bacterium]
MNFKNKKTAIIGIGVEGISSAKFLISKGVSVSILDKKTKDQVDKEYLKQAKKIGAKLVLGEKYLKDLSEFSFIVRSPGVKLSTQEIKDVIASGANVTSQTKIFFDLCPCQIVGVTGTKGKGTTSSLIYEMLKLQGKDLPAGRQDAYLGGNIGVPPLDFLDKLNEQSIVVLELSSFQLQDIKKSPHIGVMLMMTSEHLDYHKDLPEYIESKRNLLRFQDKEDFAIINSDYVASRESDVLTNGEVYQVSREDEIRQGCYIKDGRVIISLPDGAFNKKTIDIIKTSDILLPGAHNLENVCAAVMAAYLAGVSKQNIAEVLRTFKGLEHRLELVKEVRGVRYYDDSFSTTPETAIAAIKAFTEPEILILGGSSKRSDFKELGKVILNSSNIKAIIGIGEEWIRIKFEIPNTKIPIIEGLKNMKEIVREAKKLAKTGDVVLFSPACASFDMFKNYKQRGDLFKEEVGKLK